MKNKIIILSLALCALAAAATFAALPGRSQSQNPDGGAKSIVAVETNVKPTASIRERRADGAHAANAPAFGAAAARNFSLKAELNWAFGGKQQRGWYLYSSLINGLIGTEEDASSPGFASALALWQKGAGLAPTGVLDDETLYRMVSTWQAARIKDRAYPQASELVTVPVSDFWDATRPDELRQVRRDAYAAYKRMIAAAAADTSLGLAVTKAGELSTDEKFLKIVSSFRSREYQEQLRRRSPNAGRAGLAVNSPHFTGCALDIYVGGDPVDTKDANRAVQVQTPVYRWLVRNAHKFGFRPYYYEPWHWEFVGELATDGGDMTPQQK